MIERGGGKVTDEDVTIRCQAPKAVRYEVSFPYLKPTRREPIKIQLDDKAYTYAAECAGIIFNGWVSGPADYVAELEVVVDGGQAERFEMPARYRYRRLDVYWNFCLKPGSHTITLRWLNPTDGCTINVVDAVLFDKTK